MAAEIFAGLSALKTASVARMERSEIRGGARRLTAIYDPIILKVPLDVWVIAYDGNL
jgi:hypothetical protein